MSEIVLIAAVASNGIIGAGNQMPWRLSSDLKRFKSLSLGRPVIMGRKTFESLGKPLAGRPNIVISRRAGFQPEGAQVCHGLEQAIVRASELADKMNTQEVIVIGGGQIYEMALPYTDRLEITEVKAEPEGDTLFPDIDPILWKEVARTSGEQTERDSTGFDFVTYRRRDAGTKQLFDAGQKLRAANG